MDVGQFFGVIDVFDQDGALRQRHITGQRSGCERHLVALDILHRLLEILGELKLLVDQRQLTDKILVMVFDGASIAGELSRVSTKFMTCGLPYQVAE